MFDDVSCMSVCMHLLSRALVDDEAAVDSDVSDDDEHQIDARMQLEEGNDPTLSIQSL